MLPNCLSSYLDPLVCFNSFLTPGRLEEIFRSANGIAIHLRRLQYDIIIASHKQKALSGKRSTGMGKSLWSGLRKWGLTSVLELRSPQSSVLQVNDVVRSGVDTFWYRFQLYALSDVVTSRLTSTARSTWWNWIYFEGLCTFFSYRLSRYASLLSVSCVFTRPLLSMPFHSSDWWKF